MKKFLLNVLNSEGKISSKRLISLLAFLMLCIGFIANLFWDSTIDEHIYKSMEWIVEVGMGTIVAEKFGKRGSDSSTTPDTSATATDTTSSTPTPPTDEVIDEPSEN